MLFLGGRIPNSFSFLNKNCIYLNCTWLCNIYSYNEMSTIVNQLTHSPPDIVTYQCEHLVWASQRFPVFSTVLLILVIMWYSRELELIHPIELQLIPFEQDLLEDGEWYRPKVLCPYSVNVMLKFVLNIKKYIMSRKIPSKYNIIFS